MLRVFSRDRIELVDPDHRLYVEFSRDIEELTCIIDEHDVSRTNRPFLSAMRRLVHDSPMRVDDSTESIGRNTQWELLLYAYASRARMKPVTLAEPDVRCTLDGHEWGISAKRIKSTNPLTVRDNIDKAIEQIERGKLPGIIALDMSYSRNPENHVMASSLFNQLFPMVIAARSQAYCKKFVADFFTPDYKSAYKKAGVVGILVFDHMIRYLDDGKLSLDGTSEWHYADEEDPQNLADLDAFSNRFITTGFPFVKDMYEK